MPKLDTLFLWLLVACTGACASGDRAPNTAGITRLAENVQAVTLVDNAMKRKDYVTAIAILDGEITKNADSPSWQAALYATRGRARTHLKQYRVAVSDLSTAISLDSSNYYFFQSRAWAYMGLNQGENALSDLSTAISMQPDDVELYSIRATVNLVLKRLRDALADMDTVIRLKPELSAVWFIRGAILERMGRYADALQDYRRALLLDSANVNAREGVARILLGLTRGRRQTPPPLPRPDSMPPVIQI